VVTTIFGERFTAATTSPEQIPSSGKTLGHSTLAVRLALGSSHPKVSEFIIIIYIYIFIYTYICVIYIYIWYGNGYSSKFNNVHPSGCADVIVPRCDRRGIFTP